VGHLLCMRPVRFRHKPGRQVIVLV